MANAVAARSACDREEFAEEVLRRAFEGIVENDLSDLTMRQMAILMSVAAHTNLNMSDLALGLDISMSSVSRSVDALSSKGVVRRQRNGKFVNLHITPRGKAVIGRAIGSIIRYLDRDGLADAAPRA